MCVRLVHLRLVVIMTCKSTGCLDSGWSYIHETSGYCKNRRVQIGFPSPVVDIRLIKGIMR